MDSVSDILGNTKVHGDYHTHVSMIQPLGKFQISRSNMENFWEKGKPFPARGPFMLQTHGGEIRWRNLKVREIGAEEAKKILAEADAKK